LSKRKGIWAIISENIRGSIFPPKISEDIVSNNTKIVLFGLFALVGFAILTYSVIAVGKYNPENINWDDMKNATEVQKAQLSQERFQQMDQLGGVYIAAISGSLALGGTLIAQLWGRSK
jgi:CBS domain containing-hemolysin-like protein